MLKGNVIEIGDGARRVENYPDQRASYKGRHDHFDWRGTERGQQALVAMFYFVEARMNVVQIITGSSYADFGITVKTVHDFLRRAVPEVFDQYRQDIGEEMPVELPMKRIYMWFLKHQGKGKGCKKVPSPEWPPCWATPEQLARGLEDALRAG